MESFVYTVLCIWSLNCTLTHTSMPICQNFLRSESVMNENVLGDESFHETFKQPLLTSRNYCKHPGKPSLNRYFWHCYYIKLKRESWVKSVVANTERLSPFVSICFFTSWNKYLSLKSFFRFEEHDLRKISLLNLKLYQDFEFLN